MAFDLEAISALLCIGKLPSAKALQELFDALNPELPKDLKSTEVPAPPSPIPDATVLHFNYDEGHSARFTVPQTQGGSVDFEYVMDRPTPLKFLITTLSIPAPEPAPNMENTIFMPGLNTLHEPKPGETTTEQRLEYYVRVLRSPTMAQLHPGTSLDQGDVRLSAKRAVALRLAVSALSAVVPDTFEPKIDGDDVIWSARQLDFIQTGLSSFNLIDTPLKQRLRDLLKRSCAPDGESVVLVGYSRSSVDIRSAVQDYIRQQKADGVEEDLVQRTLRDRVTVVTVGSATAGYPDGPAYVHLAAFEDPLASASGVTSKHNANRAGKDAVFLNFTSPFARGAFDSHNFGALSSQYLSVAMAANGATGLRDLWEKVQQNGKKVPPNEDELLRAMIVCTDGTQWLWSPEEAWKGVSVDALPDPDRAEAVLREGFGDAFVDALIRDFGKPAVPKFGPRSVSVSADGDGGGGGVDGGDQKEEEERRCWPLCNIS